jgi:hypothetical protein
MSTVTRLLKKFLDLMEHYAHNGVPNSLPHVVTLSNMTPVNTLTTFLFKIHVNIIHTSTSPSVLLLSGPPPPKKTHTTDVLSVNTIPGL